MPAGIRYDTIQYFYFQYPIYRIYPILKLYAVVMIDIESRESSFLSNLFPNNNPLADPECILKGRVTEGPEHPPPEIFRGGAFVKSH